MHQLKSHRNKTTFIQWKHTKWKRTPNNSKGNVAETSKLKYHFVPTFINQRRKYSAECGKEQRKNVEWFNFSEISMLSFSCLSVCVRLYSVWVITPAYYNLTRRKLVINSEIAQIDFWLAYTLNDIGHIHYTY